MDYPDGPSAWNRIAERLYSERRLPWAIRWRLFPLIDRPIRRASQMREAEESAAYVRRAVIALKLKPVAFVFSEVYVADQLPSLYRHYRREIPVLAWWNEFNQGAPGFIARAAESTSGGYSGSLGHFATSRTRRAGFWPGSQTYDNLGDGVSALFLYGNVLAPGVLVVTAMVLPNDAGEQEISQWLDAVHVGPHYRMRFGGTGQRPAWVTRRLQFANIVRALAPTGIFPPGLGLLGKAAQGVPLMNAWLSSKRPVDDRDFREFVHSGQTRHPFRSK